MSGVERKHTLSFCAICHTQNKSDWTSNIRSLFLPRLTQEYVILNPDIDIILPCYNPPAGWDRVVIEQLEMLRKQLPDKHIRAIVVNDGSDSNIAGESMERLEETARDLLLLSYPINKGKGFAIRTGVQHSLASVIVYTDIDFPYTTESMIQVILPVIHREADVTLAIRNETYYSRLPPGRRWMSKARPSCSSRTRG